MSKKDLISFSLFFIFCLFSFSFAQQESMTITTYYPSPYGSYKELRSQKMAIGSTYYDSASHPWNEGGVCFADQICNADLVVEGNVGIGTRTPYSRLSVVSSDETSGLSMFVAGYEAGRQWGTRIFKKDCYQGIGNPNACNGIPLAIETQQGDTWYTSALFSHGQDSNHPTLRTFGTTYLATGGGNVGIGTTTPGRRLDIVDSAPYLPLRVSSSHTGVGAGVELDAAISGGGGRNWQIISSGSTNGTIGGGKLALRDPSAGGPDSNTYRFLIDTSGNVGIGTTGPDSKLQVAGTVRLHDANQAYALYFEPSGASNIGLGKLGNEGAPWTGSHTSFAGFTPTTADLLVLGFEGISFGTRQSSDKLTMRITSGGNVGIGTTNPGSYKLNVAGTINTSGGCTGCSDARWKTNIAPISAPLDKIMALTGVQFNWKTKEYPSMFFQEGLDYGLVAQDVEKALPEIVYEDNGYKYIRYDRLSAILIETAKEQQKEIKEQQKEINDLKEELAQQKAEIASLKEKL